MLRRPLAVGRFGAPFALVMTVMTALVAACASPTLPLPPPEAPSQAIADSTHVRLVAGCGGAESFALIAIRNKNPTIPADEVGVLSQANGCGAWDATVLAQRGDVLEITQQFGLTVSIPLDVQVR